MGATKNAWASALMVLALGCAPPSEVVLVIEVEDGLELRALSIETHGPRGTSRPVDLEGPGPPWTLGLVSRAGRGDADVTVHATTADGRTLQQRARTPFGQGERRLLYFYLSASCAERAATETETCFDGATIGVVREACAFVEPLPTGPSLACSNAVDAGRPDSGVRDAGPADAGPPSDAGPDAGPVPGVRVVAVGLAHACAIDEEGAVWCWGSNEEGELGIADRLPRGSPRRVDGLSDVVDLALGDSFGCALDASGRVWCLGANGDGQLGTADVERSATPLEVTFAPAVNVVEIVAGRDFVCARGEGTILCWGAGGEGQLGPNAPAASSHVPRPVETAGLSDVEALAAGDSHVCAWGDGRARCWGLGTDGQLAVEAFTDIKAVAAGRAHTCVFVSGPAEVRCVGADDFGQSAGHQRVPATGLAELVAGGDATCLLDADERRCWGRNDANELALVAPGSGAGPTPGVEETDWRSLAMGRHSSCGLDTAGLPSCWGFDLSGAVGRGSALTAQAQEVLVTSDSSDPQTFSQLAAGDDFTCGRSGNDVYCWGAGESGQHGDGQLTVARSTRLDLARVSGAAEGAALHRVVAGARHACIGTSSLPNRLLCWGDNLERGVAQSDDRVFPTPINQEAIEVEDGAAIATGAGNTCWLGTLTVSCIGNNDAQQGAPGSVPRSLLVGAAPVDLALGRAHVCAALQDREVHCFGDNRGGQLGYGPGGDSGAFVQIASTVGVAEVAAGRDFTCGLQRPEDEVLCWGGNTLGQLGRDGTTELELDAAPIDHAAHRWIGVRAGGASACVFDATSVVCWGDNRFGQLDDSGEPHLEAPTPMPLPDDIRGGVDIHDVALGPRHRCVSFEDREQARDRTFCWGSDEHGRAGSRRTLVFEAPQAVTLSE